MPQWLVMTLNWLRDSVVGEAVRGTPFLYPTIESLHIVGIAMLVGPAFMFDLRLLGAGRQFLSVTRAARYLLPASHVGLALSLATGVALLSAQPVVVAEAGSAPWKLGLLLGAAVNVLVFHRGVYRRVPEWSDAPRTPVAAQVAAGLSLTAWTGVIFAGRFLAYT